MYILLKICIHLSCSDVHKTVVFAYALSYNYLNTTRTSGKTTVWVNNWKDLYTIKKKNKINSSLTTICKSKTLDGRSATRVMIKMFIFVMV